MEQINFTAIIDKFIPNIHHFIDIYDYEKVIYEKITARNEKRAKLDRYYDPFVDGDFYDLLLFTTRIEDGVTDEFMVSAMVNLLTCYDSLLGSLHNRLNASQKALLTETIGKVFRNANNQYRHYFGELFALDVALSSNFEFIESASPLGNRKDAEYLIKDKNDGNTYLLEVVNVNLPDFNKEEQKLNNDEAEKEPTVKLTTEEIKKKVTRNTKDKLRWKLNDKLQEGIPGDRFILFPVVWSEVNINVSQLAAGILTWSKWHIDDRILQPYYLFMIPTTSGKPRWEFERVTKILTGFERQ